MSKVIAKNISEVRLNLIPQERMFDTEDDSRFDRRIRDRYAEKYESAPKSQDEADAKGQTHFNGLMTSFCRPLSIYGDVVAGDIAPTRYLLGQAWRELVKEGVIDPWEAQQTAPRMVNVSVLAPVRYKINGVDKYCLISQIKGKALGSGEILASPAAGNVDAIYLWECLPHPKAQVQVVKDPLTAALRGESKEEINLDLSHLNPSSFVAAFDDGAGGVNMACVAGNVSLDTVLEPYEKMTMRKLQEGEDLEVSALSLLKVGCITLVPIEGGRRAAKEVVCFYPTKTGLVEKIEDMRTVRPYTEAVFEYLDDMGDFRYFMDKAGLGGELILGHLPDDIGRV